MARVAIVCAVLAVAGCVQIDKYPEEWGALDAGQPSDVCPKLSGIYGNAGEKPDGKRVYLATWLAESTGRTRQEGPQTRHRFWKDLFEAKSVELFITDGPTLQIKASGEGILQQWNVPKGQLQCKSGAITVDQTGSKSGDNVAAVGTGSLDLYRAGDRLVVNSTGTAAGVMLLVPFVVHGSSWARFSLIEER